MNKTELIAAVAAESGLTQAQATAAVDAIFSPTKGVISKALGAGDKVQVTGFGTFGVTQRAARTGTNPSNGEQIQIAASSSAKFKQGSGLKAALN